MIVSRQDRLQRVPGALPPSPGAKLCLLGEELLFLLIDLTFAGDEIDLVKGNGLGSEVELVTGPEGEEGGDCDVGGDECVGLERDEGVVTFEEGDEPSGYEGEV